MKYLTLGLFFFLAIPHSQAEALFQTEPLVRVRVINTLDTLNITAGENWRLSHLNADSSLDINKRSFQVVKLDSGLSVLDSNTVLIEYLSHLILSTTSDTSWLKIADVPYGVGWWWGGREDRLYEGEIHIYLDSSQAMCVSVHLPLENYLKGVVPYEIGGNSPLEALKAQAISARSEAVIALTSKLYSGEQHDLTSDVECQVFSGNHKRTERADQAVEATRSFVLSEAGRPINAYYASNCGGHAETIENVWPKRPRPESYQVAYPDMKLRKPIKLSSNWRMRRWLKSSPTVNCNPALEEALPSWSKSNFRWSRDFSVEEITEMVSGGQDLGRLKKIKPLKRGVSGRIILARFIFEKGRFDVSGELALRQRFSPSLRSSAFVVKKRGGRFILEGAGWGHGVGMCQSGAIALASRDWDYNAILKHYYPQAQLLNIYPEPQAIQE